MANFIILVILWALGIMGAVGQWTALFFAVNERRLRVEVKHVDDVPTCSLFPHAILICYSQGIAQWTSPTRSKDLLF